MYSTLLAYDNTTAIASLTCPLSKLRASFDNFVRGVNSKFEGSRAEPSNLIQLASRKHDTKSDCMHAHDLDNFHIQTSSAKKIKAWSWTERLKKVVVSLALCIETQHIIDSSNVKLPD